MWARAVTVVLLVVCLVGFLGVSGFRGGENKLRGLRVAIGPDVAKERCREVVANIKVG